MRAKIIPENTEQKIPDKVVYCVECKHEFSMNSVEIKEATVNLDGQDFTLVYFACSKCDKIYRVMIKDKRYDELVEDLESTKLRIQKNHGSGREEFASMLHSMVNKKHQRLKNHIVNLNGKFPGTFTFVASENNHEDKIIKYLP